MGKGGRKNGIGGPGCGWWRRYNRTATTKRTQAPNKSIIKIVEMFFGLGIVNQTIDVIVYVGDTGIAQILAVIRQSCGHIAAELTHQRD